MDYHDYITVPPERKRGQHLGPAERGAIQQLNKQGCSLRTIAGQVNCSPSTVLYELPATQTDRLSHPGGAIRGIPRFHLCSLISHCPSTVVFNLHLQFTIFNNSIFWHNQTYSKSLAYI